MTCTYTDEMWTKCRPLRTKMMMNHTITYQTANFYFPASGRGATKSTESRAAIAQQRNIDKRMALIS